MNPRYQLIEGSENFHQNGVEDGPETFTEQFGVHVFNRNTMKKMLPPEVFKNFEAAADGMGRLKPEYADTIAVAMKEWATSHGATHFTHWFHPLTGASAEKHDSFIEWGTASGEIIEKFTGKQLIQGEPDASSFPSGGLRSTYEARGYTGWDPTSPAFLWHGGDGVTLCIPSVFFSWTGDILDSKIPLHRSERKLSDAVLRLLKLTGIEAKRIYVTLGLEQEYFVIDRHLRNLRPDLVLTGRTLFGAPSAKGQELQDHYFGAVKDSILAFMQDFESRAVKLGIPVKTRHNEVAPSQHEIALVFEKASTAVDHNIMIMELMRKTAAIHGLACLLHEKPFFGLNGSGKHANWSMMTDKGLNLLNPTDSPENKLHFLVLLAAILDAIHTHSVLLRASIGSAANDHRLGGHEAPPAIISAYLGDALESLLTNIEKSGSHVSKKGIDTYTFELTAIPELAKDNTDRNRTSPFAFTGNKFEFRAVGSSANAALPITVLNTIVAESVNQIVEEIESRLTGRGEKNLLNALIPVLQKYIKKAKDVRFSGDNYSESWVATAKKRKLPNLKKSTEAFSALLEPKTVRAFKDILTKEELISRYEVMMERYIQTSEIEVRLMQELFRTEIYPAAVKTQKDLATSLVAFIESGGAKRALPLQRARLEKLSQAIEKALKMSDGLDEAHKKSAKATTLAKRAELISHQLLDAAEMFRSAVDQLETLTDDQYWTMPKYRELLFWCHD